MDWIDGIQRAINYIEDNLTGDIDYEQAARESFSSPYHFQRLFGILCGCTLGEYIRARRLTLAGAELASGRIRVIDAALKYGYDSPDSFAKAFYRFHGVLPSQAKNGAPLKSFSRLSFKITLEGGKIMNYRIETMPGLCLTGFKRRFTGAPDDRRNQDHEFAISTRLNQYILQGIAHDCDTTYEVIANVDDEGYDFYLASRLPKYALEDFDEDLGPEIAARFEHIQIPAGTYFVCETEHCQYPCDLIEDLRREAVTNYLPSSGYELADAPSFDIIHWYYEEGNDQLNASRYVEVWLPVVKK